MRGWRGVAQLFTGQGGSMDYELTVRNKCLSILNEMIEKFGDFAIQAILVASEKFLLNLPEENTTATLLMIASSLADLGTVRELSQGVFESEAKFGALVRLSSVDVRETLRVGGEGWRKAEVALLVLGRFSEDIIVFQSKQTGAFDIESFVRGIVRQVREEEYYALLKGQSLYCLTRFTEIISIKYRPLFADLVLAAASCLPDCLPLQLIACKALAIFLKKINKHRLELSPEQLAALEDYQPVAQVVQIELCSETLPQVMEVLVELTRHRQLAASARPPPNYFLSLFHHCLGQQSLLTTFLGLLEGTCDHRDSFAALASLFLAFAGECLRAYSGVLHSEQKKNLKPADSELILTALRVAGVFIEKADCHSGCAAERERMVELLPTVEDILKINEDVQVQVALSLYVKGVVRVAGEAVASRRELVESVVGAVRALLTVPKDKAFESASIYAGNLTILLFESLLRRNHN